MCEEVFVKKEGPDQSLSCRLGGRAYLDARPDQLPHLRWAGVWPTRNRASELKGVGVLIVIKLSRPNVCIKASIARNVYKQS